jgi:hypothetical protein
MGLALVVTWILILVFKASRQRQIQIDEDLLNPSASDFTAMIEDCPKAITREGLQRILNEYV